MMNRINAGLRRAKGFLCEERTAFLFIAPFIIGFVVLNLTPLFYSIFMSFVNFNELGEIRTDEFVGFKNYIRIFDDRIALQSYGRSFFFLVVYVAGIIFLSLFLALLLNRKLFLRTGMLI